MKLRAKKNSEIDSVKINIKLLIIFHSYSFVSLIVIRRCSGRQTPTRAGAGNAKLPAAWPTLEPLVTL